MSGRPVTTVVELSAEDQACVAALRAQREAMREREVADCLAAEPARAVSQRDVHASAPARAAAVLQARRAVLVRETAAHPRLARRMHAIEAQMARAAPAREVAAELDAVQRLVDGEEDLRIEQSLVLEHIARAAPDGLVIDVASARRAPDGSLRVSAGMPRGGTLGMTLSAGGGDRRTLVLDPARAAIDRLRTADGLLAGCDAEHEYGRRLVEHLRSQGVEIRLEAQPPSAARAADGRTRDASR
jgi:hypothetical protein